MPASIAVPLNRSSCALSAIPYPLYRKEHATRHLLILTGSMGAGKSTILAEASDLLAQRGIAHAAIDADALSLASLPANATTEDIQFTNLRSVCENYAALGIERFLLARAIETRAELEACRKAVSATEVMLCRVLARVETMQQRVRGRETGIFQQQYVDRVSTLNAILDTVSIEDFTVVNDGCSVTEAAREVLQKAGWIAA